MPSLVVFTTSLRISVTFLGAVSKSLAIVMLPLVPTPITEPYNPANMLSTIPSCSVLSPLSAKRQFFIMLGKYSSRPSVIPSLASIATFSVIHFLTESIGLLSLNIESNKAAPPNSALSTRLEIPAVAPVKNPSI